MSVRIDVAFVDAADRSVPFPVYQTAGAAGADLCANFAEGQRGGVVIAPGQRALIPTGLRMQIPPGFEVQVRPRSGLALRHGIVLPNAPGTIDSDYRGEVGVIVANIGAEPFVVTHGMRIAQAVVAPVVRADWCLVGEVTDTSRGAGGFGSTGLGGQERRP